MPDLARQCLTVLALSLVASTTSVTLAKARVFRGLRERVARCGPWLRDLFHCPYCLSHWIALGLTLIYRPALLFSGYWAMDIVANLFVIVALAAIWSKHICGALQAMDALADRARAQPRQESPQLRPERRRTR